MSDRHGKRVPHPCRTVLWSAIGLAAAGILVYTVVPKAALSQGRGLTLTHTVTRGDLMVTVTEQGTLESAENTEIKCRVRDKEIPITWVIENGSEVKPGDVLVRLATLAYEDRLNQVSRWVYSSRANLARSTANIKRARLAVSEYIEGQYVTQLKTLQKDLAVAESALRTARNMLTHTETMAQRGYVSGLDLEQAAFAVTQAELNVGVKKKEIQVLTDYTRDMRLKTLKGNLEASLATHEANKAQVENAEAQLILCQGDLENCVVRAERTGIVVYPTGKPWERMPEIEEGTDLYMGQTMLLMPDLSQMQVKLGIKESHIDRMKAGLKARVRLPNRTLVGKVTFVAEVTGPAGWWNGNAVRYDTIVSLPGVSGLMPGMSAQVEVIVAQYRDVLTVPVAALVECPQGAFCWVKTPAGPEKRVLRLGDTNDCFTVVEAGVQAGDQVVLNPLALEEARALARTLEDTPRSRDPNTLPSPKHSPSGSKAKTAAVKSNVNTPSKGAGNKTMSPDVKKSGSKQP